jgi:transposase
MTCTNEQIRILMQYAITHTQEVAAAKAGMSLRTAKRYLQMKGKRKKPQRKPRTWRTREDPFKDISPTVREMLKRDPGLEAKTLMEWLLAQHPGKFDPGQERTLRRRVREWRVLEGPERREVMFPQNILPGRQSQSDYTHCNELQVTIAGAPFRHMVFHFMLPYSRWEFVWICFTESFETLTTGFGRAVRALGYVAPEHRTDNLAAAVPIGEHHVFQKRWEDFLKHFGCEPSANNPRRSHENGSVEKSHDLFKHAIDQRLRLRCSRDFVSVEEYERFLDNAVAERNRQRGERLKEEIALLKALPANDWYDPRQYSSTVSAWSTISVAGALYSVPSRYIGQKLRVLVDYQSVKVYYERHLVLEAVRRESGSKCINYRHVIFHLLRKPGAFRNYQFREELFPRLVFRHAYDALLSHNEERADKEYLLILNYAALGSEDCVAAALTHLLASGSPPTIDLIRPFCETPKSVPDVEVHEAKLDIYDKLLTLDTLKEQNG